MPRSTTGISSIAGSPITGATTRLVFLPRIRLLPYGTIADFKTMVKRLHDAGIEVILDVVYNHTGEGNHLGPDAVVPRHRQRLLLSAGRRSDATTSDFTGTGNTLNLDHPRVLADGDGLAALLGDGDARRWLPLRPVRRRLARENGEFGQGSGLLRRHAPGPGAWRGVKLIAEPWDLGPFGYQLGDFPPGWAEWNGRYRDTLRRFWNGDQGLVAEVASRVAGSSDIFGWSRATAVGQHQFRHRP